MNVPFLDLNSYHQEIKTEVFAQLEACYDKNAFCLGSYVESFETELANYSNSPYAVGVNSGTSALHLALLAIGVGPGDEVIVPAMTFVSTAWSVSYCGATPVFADVCLDTRNMDPASVEALITSKTKAIITVHLYGMPAAMDQFRDICDKHGIGLVEDAAQALGASYLDDPIGSWGDATCLSFYPGKNLGAIGEGGAILTRKSDIDEKVRSLRNHGTKGNRYIHESVGYNYRMDGLQAAALSIKLKGYDKRNAQRIAVAEAYGSRLKELDSLKIPTLETRSKSVWHLYVVLVEKRDEQQVELANRGIATGLHYPVPLHLQPCYQFLNVKKGACPNAEYIADNCLSLPIFPELSSEALEYVCEHLRDILEN